MFDVTIYYKDNRRGMYDHVSEIKYLTLNQEIALVFITDFNDKIRKHIPADQIAEMKVKTYES